LTLEAQTVVVLGGTSGIGLEVVRQAAASGARAIAVGRDARKLDAALQGIKGQVSGATLDARDRKALDAFFAGVGAVDHLVLTLSGGEGAGPFETLDLGSLRRGFEAKFWPQLEAAQAALPCLRGNANASLTFVSAISARLARPGASGLAAINGALESMVGALARELAPVRVNAVSPGVIDTPWWAAMPAAVKDEIFEEQRRTLPVSRVGQPGHVAHAIRFLMENAFVTGTVIECDGGLRLVQA